MAFSINTNEAALIALRTLGKATQNLTATSLRVSTGQRVSSPAEDGAVFAIGKKTASDVAAWGAVRERQVFGRLVIDTALEGATSISNTLLDLKAEAAEYGGINNEDQKRYIRQSMISKMQEINNAVKNSDFNGKNLLCANEPYSANAPSGNPQPSSLANYAFIGKNNLGDYGLYTAGGVVAGGVGPANASNLTLDWNIAGTPLNIDIIYQAYADPAHGNFTLGATTTAMSFPSVTGKGSAIVPWPANAGGWDLVLVKATAAGPPPPPTSYNISLTDRSSPAPAQTSPDGGSFTVLKDIDGNLFHVDYHLMTAEGLGLVPFTFDPIDQGMKQIDDAVAAAGDNINYWSGKSRLIDNTMRFGDTMTDALQMANGAILDADMAAESAKLEAEKIKQQLAVQTQSITNNALQLLLGLFR